MQKNCNDAPGEGLTVISHQDDLHARIIVDAIQNIGCKAHIISTSDLPKYATASVTLGSNQCASWRDELNKLYNLPHGVYWNRRRLTGALPEDLHPDDHKFAQRSVLTFNRWLFDAALLGGIWVNDPMLARRADNKLLQLKAAFEVGLTIPETIVGNDFTGISEFLSRESRGGFVVKPLVFASWSENGKISTPFTEKITREEIENDVRVTGAPMIYQECIEKRSELRVTVMGDTIVAAEIDSQKLDKAKTDWRVDMAGEATIRPYTLPDKIAKRIHALMRKLELRFGAIDMAITPDGDYVFFEVNEMGQFLWLEQQCEDIRLLQTITGYLLTLMDPGQNWTDAVKHLKFDDYMSGDWFKSWEVKNAGNYQEATYAQF